MAVEITFIGTINSTPQEYNPQDTALISSTVNFPTLFDQNSYIELFISDLNNNILTSDLQFNKYKVINNGKYIENEKSLSSIQLDVENVLSFYGYSQGEYIISFNFYSKHIGSSLQKLYISEISSDRTELRLDSTELAFLDIVESTNNFVQERDQSSYFVDFYLNFGDNKLVLANNIELDDSDINNPTILVKLYNPLPTNFNVNSTLWIVTTLIDLNTTNYRASYPIEPIVFNDTISISGPNFNLDLKDQVNNSTLELSYFDILNTSLSSSTNQINSLLEEKEIDINIDYTNFNNFVHFSSAQVRLENFYYENQNH